jgi:hypothetical protein
MKKIYFFSIKNIYKIIIIKHIHKIRICLIFKNYYWQKVLEDKALKAKAKAVILLKGYL